MSIYGHVPHDSWCKLKLTSRAVNAVSLSTPKYLQQSESPITFDQTYHLDCIAKQFVPFRQITLHVTFGDASNYRTEMLAFEVVDFSGPYHIILGASFIKDV
jgi:hypothetical protein